MHKKKLVFLSISFLLLLFASFGTTYAFTYDDFVEFISQTSNLITGTNASQYKASASYIIANKEYIREQCLLKGYDLDNYNGFIMGRTNDELFYFYATNTQNAYTTQTANINFAASTTILTIHKLSAAGEFRTLETTGTNKTFKAWGLMDYNPSNGFNQYSIMQNYYNNITPNVDEEYNSMEINSVPRIMGTLRLGNYTEYSPVVRLFQGDNELNVNFELTSETSVSGGYLWTIMLPNDLGNNLNSIIDSDDYYLKCYDDGNIIVSSPQFTIKNNLPTISVVPVGQITNASGDITGNINLDGVVGAIQDGNNAILEAITSSEVKSGDELTSGDLQSFGISIEEESGEKLGQTKEFFTWVLTEFKSVLENNENTTLDIPIYTTHNEVRSDFFVLPNGILRTFISAGWWFIVGVPFIKYIRRTIQKIKGGDIPNSDEKSDLLGNIL